MTPMYAVGETVIERTGPPGGRAWQDDRVVVRRVEDGLVVTSTGRVYSHYGMGLGGEYRSIRALRYHRVPAAGVN